MHRIFFSERKEIYDPTSPTLRGSGQYRPMADGVRLCVRGLMTPSLSLSSSACRVVYVRPRASQSIERVVYFGLEFPLYQIAPKALIRTQREVGSILTFF